MSLKWLPSLVFSHKILWFGLIIIATVVCLVAYYQQNKNFNWKVSSQKAYCQEQQQNRLQRLSQFNDELMNYAIGAKNNPASMSTEQYLSHRNILRFILFSKGPFYSVKKHWYKKNLFDNQSIEKLHIKDLMFWLSKELNSLDLKHPMYFINSPFKNLLVVVPLTIPTEPSFQKEIAIFEIEKEALAVAMGESQICLYGIWNHKGEVLFANQIDHLPSLLNSQPSVKGEILVKGSMGNDLILFEQHPSSIVIAHKLLLQELYRQKQIYIKDVLFILGILSLLWCFLMVLLSAYIASS